jgi:predicted neutral ceramidase superfamily lipid hydrolase
MVQKDDVNKVVEAVKDTVANVKDTASEAVHRVAAQVEQQKRNLVGDQMTTGEKASSMISQAKQTAQGDIDAMKREDRNKA